MVTDELVLLIIVKLMRKWRIKNIEFVKQHHSEVSLTRD